MLYNRLRTFGPVIEYTGRHRITIGQWAVLNPGDFSHHQDKGYQDRSHHHNPNHGSPSSPAFSNMSAFKCHKYIFYFSKYIKTNAYLIAWSYILAISPQNIRYRVFHASVKPAWLCGWCWDPAHFLPHLFILPRPTIPECFHRTGLAPNMNLRYYSHPSYPKCLLL